MCGLLVLNSYCSRDLSLVQRPYIEKEIKYGKLSINYSHFNREYTAMKIALTKELIQPVFVLHPLVQEPLSFKIPDHIETIDRIYNIEGTAENGYTYKFDIPVGKYYSSFVVDVLGLITFGYRSKKLMGKEFENEYKDNFVVYEGDACSYYHRKSQKIYCPILRIDEEKNTQISIYEIRKNSASIMNVRVIYDMSFQ